MRVLRAQLPAEVGRLGPELIEAKRTAAEIKATGHDVPPLCWSFEHFGFDEKLTGAIKKQNFTAPTPIQCQAVPAALSGRDIIGIAKTGSGTHLARTPVNGSHARCRDAAMDARQDGRVRVAHARPRHGPARAQCVRPAPAGTRTPLMQSPLTEEGEGPIAIILSPTRELAHQIYIETHRFAKVPDAGCDHAHLLGAARAAPTHENSRSLQVYNLVTAAVYGGMQKYEQTKALKASERGGPVG